MVSIIDLATWNRTRITHMDKVWDIEWTCHGERIATVFAACWGEAVIDLHLTGDWLAQACRDGVLRIICTESGLVEREIPHGDVIFSLSLNGNPIHERIATGCRDGRLRIIDLASGLIERQVGHGDGNWIFAVVFHGETVCSGSKDRKV